jgi:hypothetical protein
VRVVVAQVDAVGEVRVAAEVAAAPRGGGGTVRDWHCDTTYGRRRWD